MPCYQDSLAAERKCRKTPCLSSAHLQDQAFRTFARDKVQGMKRGYRLAADTGNAAAIWLSGYGVVIAVRDAENEELQAHRMAVVRIPLPKA